MDLEKIFCNKKVLITGGLGFLGSNLAIKLVSFGAQVTVADSLVKEYGGNLFNIDAIKEKVNVNISDVRDSASMNHLVQKKDYLFNLAGTLSHIDSMRNPFTDLEINCASQLSILEACRHNNPDIKIVFAGTRGQYGKVDYLPVDEKHLIHPTDINGINNAAGEGYHILYNDMYGIRSASLRLTNTFGPRHQMKHHRQGVLNWFLRSIIDNQEIELYGHGEQIRDTNYVDDVIKAFLLAMVHEETNGQVYNLGGIPVSLKSFIEKAIQVCEKGSYKLVPFPEVEKQIEIGDYVADYSKIKKETGWEPKITLDQGIAETYSYYLEHKDKYWSS